MLLEKPDYDVLDMYSQNIHSVKIIKHCQVQYSSLNQNMPRFVHEIVENIDRLNEKKQTSGVGIIFPSTNLSKVSSENQYLFGTRYITIRYDSEYLMDLIHPLFLNLETNNIEDSIYLFEPICRNNYLILKSNHRTIGTFQSHEVVYFKGAIFKYLNSFITSQRCPRVDDDPTHFRCSS